MPYGIHASSSCERLQSWQPSRSRHAERTPRDDLSFRYEMSSCARGAVRCCGTATSLSGDVSYCSLIVGTLRHSLMTLMRARRGRLDIFLHLKRRPRSRLCRPLPQCVIRAKQSIFVLTHRGFSLAGVYARALVVFYTAARWKSRPIFRKFES